MATTLSQKATSPGRRSASMSRRWRRNSSTKTGKSCDTEARERRLCSYKFPNPEILSNVLCSHLVEKPRCNQNNIHRRDTEVAEFRVFFLIKTIHSALSAPLR